MSQIFNDMPAPTVSVIIKGLESKVKMMHNYYKDDYIPSEGILKFIDYVSHNTALTHAAKKKIESIRTYITLIKDNDSNISDALIRKYISLMLN